MRNCVILYCLVYFSLVLDYMQRNVVAYDEDQPRELEKATVIQDAISDLPAVLFFILLLLFFCFCLDCFSKVSFVS